MEVIKLRPENELQVVVGDESESVGLKLITGLAEIFGTEMEVNKVYMFPPSTSIAVFTWEGCKIEVIGRPQSWKKNDEPSLMLHIVLHDLLKEMRQKAESENNFGPIILVVGPMESGKSTLCRTLLNYAVRDGRQPYYVDLSVANSSTSIPGTVNVLKVKETADIVEGFNQDSMEVYQFGFRSPGNFIALYFLLIRKIGRVLRSYLRETTSSNARHSGIVIDTHGWTKGLGFNALSLAARSFKIDKLAVLEDERLYGQLKQNVPSFTEVLFVPKKSGVMERNKFYRRSDRHMKLHKYFYGSSIPLQPYSFELKFSDIQIYRVVAVKNVTSVIVSENVLLSDVVYTAMRLGPLLLNQVLALSSADSVLPEMLLATTLGFVCVTGVDMDKKTIRVLSPQPKPLPSKIFIMGDTDFINTTIE